MQITVRNITSGFTQKTSKADWNNPKIWTPELRRKFEVVNEPQEVPKEVKKALSEQKPAEDNQEATTQG